jgi:hypothetical protein
MKYLITTEDGKVYQSEKLNEYDIDASTVGIITIVDVVNNKIHVEDEDWETISKWDNQ